MISEKDALARRRKIKLSAYTLFQEKGVDSVTFGDIALHSQVSESSIYRYFPKKSILMLELNKYLWKEIATELRRRTTELPAFQAACGFDQISWLIDAFEQVHLSHPGYLKFSLECKLYWIRKGYIVNRDEYDNIISPVMQLFTDVMSKGVEDSSISLDTDFDTSCFLLWGVLRSYVEQIAVLDTLYNDQSSFGRYFQAFKMYLLKTFGNQGKL